LEGAWHGFLPHPLVAGYQSVKRLSDEEMRARIRQPEDSAEGLALLPYFDGLSSAETGILHIWEEGDLPQIPFAACRVQAVDATAEGPAGLLPEKVCLGLTHEEARRKAGLVGIEAYTANILSSLDMKDFPVKDGIAVGAGQTFAEALSRGLQKCLSHAWVNRPTQASPDITPVEIVSIEDELCRYGLDVLAATQGPLTLGLGDKLHGFPVVWLGTGKAWYATVGLSVPLALRYVLEQALLARPSQATPNTIDERKRLTIQQCDRTIQAKTLLDALVTLRDNGMCIDIVDLSIEPFMRETIAGVFGVWLREEASQ
jgi:putative thiazole-containing bacteriocin maturation protein